MQKEKTMTRHERLERQFEEFHDKNPHIYQLLVKYARQVKAAGMKKYSVYALFERVRWHIQVETSDINFKLNNNHRPFYARLLMQQEVEFEGFFDIREQISKRQF